MISEKILHHEIIKNGEFTETINKKVISSETFKVFVEDILNGKINDNKIEKYIKKSNNIEKDLNKSKKLKKLIN